MSLLVLGGTGNPGSGHWRSPQTVHMRPPGDYLPALRGRLWVQGPGLAHPPRTPACGGLGGADRGGPSRVRRTVASNRPVDMRPVTASPGGTKALHVPILVEAAVGTRLDSSKGQPALRRRTPGPAARQLVRDVHQSHVPPPVGATAPPRTDSRPVFPTNLRIR